MESAKEQLLRNPDIKPSSNVVAKVLREANSAYVKFVNELASHDIHQNGVTTLMARRSWQRDFSSGQAGSVNQRMENGSSSNEI